MEQEEKLSLINGRIHTQTSVASNITFEHGRIASIDDDVGNISGKIVDLHGRTVLPGFCDTGTDFLSWTEGQERLNLSNMRSAKELIGTLSTYARSTAKPLRGWYIGYNLPDSVIISRDDLDAAVPELPCAIADAGRTHVVLNSAAMNAFNMPQDNVELDEFAQHLPDLSEEDIMHLVKVYAPKINALGITELWANLYGDTSKLWRILFNKSYNSLSFRLRCCMEFENVNALNEFLASGLRTGDGLPFCKLGGIIVKGELEQQVQKNMIYSAHLSGCQIISDNNKSCLNALERVIKRAKKNSRHIIRGISQGLLDRMKMLGLGGIITPGQDDSFMHEAFQNGLVVSCGSDDTLTPPLKYISTLVSHGLSVAEALSVYTWSASWNGGNEFRRGELAVGNDADAVVLEQDPYLVRPEEIAGINVSMTFCAGRVVYDSGAV